MATEVITTVIPAGGGDYTLLSTWESGEQTDLVAADEIAVAECHSGSITDAFSMAGWTTDATRYTIVRAASGHEHGGIPGAGFRITRNTAGNAISFTNHTGRIIGIEVANSSTGGGIGTASGSAGREMWIQECLVGPTGSFGINVGHETIVFINNNIVYDVATNCIGLTSSLGTVHCYNNTGIGGTFGVRQTNGTMRPKNNIMQGQATSCFSGTMTNSETNISSDETGEIQATLTFLDATNDDYHLDASDTEAIGAGTDLSADANLPVTIDIDLDERAATPCIGADELVAPAAGNGRRLTIFFD